MPKVRLNDIEIYYEEHGRGRPMLFLSETACDGEVWKIHQVPEFSRDHRVIIHDYRGTGQSSKPSIDYTTRMRLGSARRAKKPGCSSMIHVRLSERVRYGIWKKGNLPRMIWVYG